MQLGSRASKKYSDPNSWHNQFYSLVTTKIDEEIFKPLFPEGKKSGRPNASIRILVAMSVLKEGFGCSDEDLFEKCEFDLLTRKALGMELLTDVTPSIDTYYLFRRRICEYQERTGIDLMQLCFEQLAGKHVHLLKISGKCVRMDSKLIGSNIARQSRYELIHTTLVKFLKTCTLSHLSPEQEERAREYLKEDSSKTVYRSDSDTLQSNLARIGNFIMEILAVFPATSPAHDLLQRLFDEQYVVMDGKAVLRDKKEVKADSLQNTNDPDATYRAKNDQKVQGYVTNITETVEEGKDNSNAWDIACYKRYTELTDNSITKMSIAWLFVRSCSVDIFQNLDELCAECCSNTGHECIVQSFLSCHKCFYNAKSFF